MILSIKLSDLTFVPVLALLVLVILSGCQKWHHQAGGVEEGEQPAYTVGVDRSRAHDS